MIAINSFQMNHTLFATLFLTIIFKNADRCEEGFVGNSTAFRENRRGFLQMHDYIK